MKYFIFTLLLIILVVKANKDDKDLIVNLSNNNVNLNLKCKHYTDCYNCTLARCEWGPSVANKKKNDCKMRVHLPIEDDDGHIEYPDVECMRDEVTGMMSNKNRCLNRPKELFVTNLLDMGKVCVDY